MSTNGLGLKVVALQASELHHLGKMAVEPPNWIMESIPASQLKIEITMGVCVRNNYVKDSDWLIYNEKEKDIEVMSDFMFNLLFFKKQETHNG